MNKSTIIMLIFNGLSSILLGTMYLFHYWISFRFLGSEIGSESSITSLLGIHFNWNRNSFINHNI
jgi:hypothetical protein